MDNDLIGFEEVIELKGEMNVVEEFLNVDASMIELEKNKDLIRLEMNIVEFPIFSKNSLVKINQIRKYYFSSDKKSFLEILPAVNTQIPGEIEERVFIALTKILRNNNFSKVFYCTINDIFDNMKIANKTTRKGMYNKIRLAISKMATTTFRFQNIFYSNEIKNVVGDLIETSILNFRAITLNDANTTEKNFFTDKRTKEIYKISISDHFYDNIIQKGYLAFDADELLSIKDSVTRSIYTMITKWRHNNLYLKKQAYFIARRIPLAWDKNPRRTVLRIEESFKSLKEFGYINNYKFNKTDKYEKAEFEIYFDESHNKIKREIFYDEKNNFDKLVHSIEDRQQEIELNLENLFTDKAFLDIFKTFSPIAQRFKTLPNVIREALKKYDYNYVKYTAEYTTINCKASYIKYFKDSLENNWADEFIVKKELKAEKKAKLQEKSIEEAVLLDDIKKIEPKYTWEDFISLDPVMQNQIDKITYEDFLKQSCSGDNKIMQGIFNKSKKSLIIKTMETFDFETIEKEEIEIIPILEIKHSEETETLKSDKIQIKDNFASFSHFLLAVNKFVAKHNIKIELSEVISIFKLLGEYEDFTIKFTYNETTKLGEIIKKL